MSDELREQIAGAETIDVGGVEVTRLDVQEYRKTATVRAGRAMRAGILPTLEGDHSFSEGDYIAGPGAAGEFWPVKRDIFERTYAPAALTRADNGLDVDVLTAALHATHDGVDYPDGHAAYERRTARAIAAEYARLAQQPAERAEKAGHRARGRAMSEQGPTPAAALRALTEKLRDA